MYVGLDTSDEQTETRRVTVLLEVCVFVVPGPVTVWTLVTGTVLVVPR